MCSRAPEALNACCAGPFPSPVLIACAGLCPAEHPWSRGAQCPGGAAGAPSLRRTRSPAHGRSPLEARGALQLSHGGSPEPHQAATGFGVGLVGPPLPCGRGSPDPRTKRAGSGAALCLRGLQRCPQGWWLSPGCSQPCSSPGSTAAPLVPSVPTARQLPSSPPMAPVPAEEVLKGPKGRAAPVAPRLMARLFAIPWAAWVLSICLC